MIKENQSIPGKISVLMGIYNEKNRDYVRLAIDSILNQTYPDFEFIICDDGSEMFNYHWLEEYCKKDSRITLIRNQSNCGLAQALNICLKLAQGEYIARMDANDVSYPDRFEKEIDVLKNHQEYVLVGCCSDYIDDNGIWGGSELPEQPEKENFLWRSGFMHPTIMMRREVLVTLGGYCTDDFAERVEDYELFMRLYATGYKGYNIQKTLFGYRKDRQAVNTYRYRWRVNEARVRYRGYKAMGILKGHMRYVLKPLLVGLIPAGFISIIRKKQFGVR